MSVQERVDDFLKQKRLAMIGVSRDEKGFSRTLFKEFRQRGYDVVPVNPHTDEIAGITCFSRVQDIQPSVNAVMVVLPGSAVDQAIADSLEAGIPRIWVQNAMPNAVSAESKELCASREVSLIPGFCPYMFLPDAPFFHKIHAFFLRLFGSLN
jgi:uncharacterized protein